LIQFANGRQKKFNFFGEVELLPDAWVKSETWKKPWQSQAKGKPSGLG
jgi:hypothetical protein